MVGGGRGEARLGVRCCGRGEGKEGFGWIDGWMRRFLGY